MQLRGSNMHRFVKGLLEFLTISGTFAVILYVEWWLPYLGKILREDEFAATVVITIAIVAAFVLFAALCSPVMFSIIRKWEERSCKLKRIL
jgi:amino acid permease